jgi:glycerate kinase
VQTLHGKAPAGVAAAARAARNPVVEVCGRNTLSPDVLHEAGIRAVYALGDIEPDLARCMSEGASLLETLGARIATDHLASHATTTAGSNP